MAEYLSKFPKDEFLELISAGKLESEALEQIGFPKATMIQAQLKDSEFKEALDRAKKDRADIWFEGIAKSAKSEISREDVAGEKLKFEQRKYLAAIDNPDKYAEKTKKEIDLNISIFQEMKELPAAEAKRLLASVDPFNQIVEAEFKAASDGDESDDENTDEKEMDIFS